MRKFNLVGCLTAAAIGNVALAQVIPTFTDETATRLSAAAGVGSGDTADKEFGVGDFDKDGDDDVLVARRVGLNNNVDNPLANTLLMNVNGVLTDQTATLAPAALTSQRWRSIVIADFNNDTWPDAMIVGGTAIAPLLLINQQAPGGNWAGFASSPASLPALSLDAWSVAAGDLENDSDGFPDVFIGTRNGNDVMLFNNGGTFTNVSTNLGTNNATSAVRSAAIVDMNLDGDQDIVEGVTSPTGAIRMLANSGAGIFSSAPQSLSTGSAYNFAIADLNNDNRPDVVSVRNGNDEYRINTGTTGETITLAAGVAIPNSNGFGSIARVADLNADGFDDVLICDLDQEFPQDCARSLNIYFGKTPAPFLVDGYPAAQPWTPNGTSDVAILDVDGDGDLDLVTGSLCSGIKVFTQDGSPGCAEDLDGDGDVDDSDLGLLLASFGANGGGDIDGDNDTDDSDLGLLLAKFGTGC